MFTGVPRCLEVGPGCGRGEPGRCRDPLSAAHQQGEGLGSDKLLSQAGSAFLIFREAGALEGDGHPQGVRGRWAGQDSVMPAGCLPSLPSPPVEASLAPHSPCMGHRAGFDLEPEARERAGGEKAKDKAILVPCPSQLLDLSVSLPGALASPSVNWGG